jgi:hypothetical protein
MSEPTRSTAAAGEGAVAALCLAEQFIAETNAFLARFWGDPDVGWPRKAASAQNPAPTVPAVEAAVRADGRAHVPEPGLLARIQDIRRIVAEAYGAGGPPVYLVLLLVPSRDTRRRRAADRLLHRVEVRGVAPAGVDIIRRPTRQTPKAGRVSGTGAAALPYCSVT